MLPHARQTAVIIGRRCAACCTPGYAGGEQDEDDWVMVEEPVHFPAARRGDEYSSNRPNISESHSETPEHWRIP